MSNQVLITRGSSALRFHLPGVEFICGASPSRGSQQLCCWTIEVAAKYDSPEPHTLDRDEVLTVNSGSIQLQPDGELLGPGDTAVVPSGTPIQLTNPGTSVARVQVAIQAGFEATMADGTSRFTPPWAK